MSGRRGWICSLLLTISFLWCSGVSAYSRVRIQSPSTGGVLPSNLKQSFASSYRIAFVGNFNGDDYDDIVLISSIKLCILYGTEKGSTSFTTANCNSNESNENVFIRRESKSSYNYAVGSFVGDFNGDGKNDVYFQVANPDSSVILSYTSEFHIVENGVFDYVVGVGDVDGDGKGDLLAYDAVKGDLYGILGYSDNSQTPTKSLFSLDFHGAVRNMITADLNNDGMLDVIFTLAHSKGDDIFIVYDVGHMFKSSNNLFGREMILDKKAVLIEGTGRVTTMVALDRVVPTDLYGTLIFKMGSSTYMYFANNYGVIVVRDLHKVRSTDFPSSKLFNLYGLCGEGYGCFGGLMTSSNKLFLATNNILGLLDDASPYTTDIAVFFTNDIEFHSCVVYDYNGDGFKDLICPCTNKIIALDLYNYLEVTSSTLPMQGVKYTQGSLYEKSCPWSCISRLSPSCVPLCTPDWYSRLSEACRSQLPPQCR